MLSGSQQDGCRTLLTALAYSINAVLTESEGCFVLLLERGDGIEFEITVPKDVLEWFADAKINNEPVWSDWADYYPMDGETPEALAADMRDDIEGFVRAIAVAPMRVSQHKKLWRTRNRLEWLIDGNWAKLSLGLNSSEGNPAPSTNGPGPRN